MNTKIRERTIPKKKTLNKGNDGKEKSEEGQSEQENIFF